MCPENDNNNLTRGRGFTQITRDDFNNRMYADPYRQNPQLAAMRVMAHTERLRQGDTSVLKHYSGFQKPDPTAESPEPTARKRI